MLSEKEIDDIIAHAEDVAERNESDALLFEHSRHNQMDTARCKKCATENRNIAEGFKELKEARRMLDAMGWHYHDGNYWSEKAHKEYFVEETNERQNKRRKRL